MKTYPVAVLVGSLRRESINRQLATAMTKLAPASLSFYTVELGELPLYNGDLEESRPESVTRFTAQCARADAFFIVTPEHNRSLPAALKNALDWGSKPMDQNVWRDKPVAPRQRQVVHPEQEQDEAGQGVSGVRVRCLAHKAS